MICAQCVHIIVECCIGKDCLMFAKFKVFFCAFTFYGSSRLLLRRLQHGSASATMISTVAKSPHLYLSIYVSVSLYISVSLNLSTYLSLNLSEMIGNGARHHMTTYANVHKKLRYHAFRFSQDWSQPEKAGENHWFYLYSLV